MTYHIGQTFETTYPQEAAQWCNEHPNPYVTISETEPGKFEITDTPPTQAELAALKTAQIKRELAELDLKSIRALRAGEADYLAQYEHQAQQLRQSLTL